MKFIAASLLALAAAAINLQEGPAPKCTLPKPTEAEVATATGADVFTAIDTDSSGEIDEAEGDAALVCMVEWGVVSVDEALALKQYLGEYAGEDGKLSMSEAEQALGDAEDTTATA